MKIENRGIYMRRRKLRAYSAQKWTDTMPNETIIAKETEKNKRCTRCCSNDGFSASLPAKVFFFLPVFTAKVWQKWGQRSNVVGVVTTNNHICYKTRC